MFCIGFVPCLKNDSLEDVLRLLVGFCSAM